MSERRSNEERNPTERYTIFHALYEALKNKEKKQKNA